MRDLIIIGAGPAGLAASLYATKKRLDYVVLAEDLGGKSNYSIDLPDTDPGEQIRASELVTVYKTRLQYLRNSHAITGVCGVRAGNGSFTVETVKGSNEEARAVIVATGTRIDRDPVPGEAEFLSRGLGYSSGSYSHLLRGKRVFIAGETDRALSSALEISIHADSVTVALLEGGSFSPPLLERVRSLDRVSLVDRATLTAFEGDEYARSVTIASSGSERKIEADGFFIEPEPIPNTEFLGDSPATDDRGYLPVNGANMTAVDGLFAAGDVTGSGFEQVLVALGDGGKASLSVYRYLIEHGLTAG
ncbi:MAG: NAD(P)/FAD-dependent oxidoreductase [Spirochaetota bacterium]